MSGTGKASPTVSAWTFCAAELGGEGTNTTSWLTLCLTQAGMGPWPFRKSRLVAGGIGRFFQGEMPITPYTQGPFSTSNILFYTPSSRVFRGLFGIYHIWVHVHQITGLSLNGGIAVLCLLFLFFRLSLGLAVSSIVWRGLTVRR